MSRARHRARRLGLVWRHFIRSVGGSWARSVPVRYAILALLPLVLVSSTLTHHGNTRLPSVDRPVALFPAVWSDPAFVTSDRFADSATRDSATSSRGAHPRLPAPQVTVTARPPAVDEEGKAGTTDPGADRARAGTVQEGPEHGAERARSAQGNNREEPGAGGRAADDSGSRPSGPTEAQDSTTEPTSEPSTPDPSPTARETAEPPSSPSPPPAPDEPEPEGEEKEVGDGDKGENEEEDQESEEPEDGGQTKICINLPKLPICIKLG